MKKYQKDFGYSYSMGVFPTLELLTQHPSDILQIFIDSKGLQNAGVAKIQQIAKEKQINVEVNDKAAATLSEKENMYCVGVFKKFESPIIEMANHVVLMEPSDPGNLGTIVRTMLGFNITNLAIIKPATDIFDPKSIRSSMGAIFQVNFSYFGTFDDYQKAHPEQNLYPFMTNAQTDLKLIEFKTPFSLIFGNESSGLGERFNKIGTPVKISYSDKIDSLSLPISAGIALHKASNL